MTADQCTVTWALNVHVYCWNAVWYKYWHFAGAVAVRLWATPTPRRSSWRTGIISWAFPVCCLHQTPPQVEVWGTGRRNLLKTETFSSRGSLCFHKTSQKEIRVVKMNKATSDRLAVNSRDSLPVSSSHSPVLEMTELEYGQAEPLCCVICVS